MQTCPASRRHGVGRWQRRLLCVLGFALGVVAIAAAADPPCGGLEFHQFDFWIGDWRVAQGDKHAGENRIERILGGCALQESWSGASGSRGRSLNTYDPARHVWHQTWVDNEGTLLVLEGGLRGSSMVLEGEQPDPNSGKPVRQRITWTPLPNGDVRQHWQSSSDGGATWQTVFDGRYQRKR